MKLITFSSFKGGAGKTTATMAVCSTLIARGKKVALIDADENTPLLDWQEVALQLDSWSDNCQVYVADDLNSFEKAHENATNAGCDIAIIDTRGGGSELNNICMVNSHTIIVPSSLTELDKRAAVTTFDYIIKVMRELNIRLPVALLIQRVPVGNLTVTQKQELKKLQELPHCNTILYQRDAFAAIGKRGLLHRTHEQYLNDPVKRISAPHIAIAMAEADKLTDELLDAVGGI